MKNILVLGSNGMLGRYVVKVLSKKNNVWGTTRKEFNAIDATKESIKKLLSFETEGKKINIDLVVNCIGMIKPTIAKSNTSDAIKVNSVLPHLINEAVKEIDHELNFIHITTDCVYSGKLSDPKLGYDEEDLHDEEDVYGLTKFLGEPSEATVIRTSIIGEEIDQSRSLIEWVKQQKNQGANGYTNHYWNGVTCLQLGKILQRMIDKNNFWSGTKHIHSNAVDKFQLLEMINKSFNLNIEVTPVDGPQYCNRTMSSIYEDSEELNPETLEKQINELAKFTDELNA